MNNEYKSSTKISPLAIVILVALIITTLLIKHKII